MKEIVIAVVSLVAGAIIGPYINWGIEKRKQRLAYKRQLVTKWRAMLSEAAKQDIGRGKEVEKLLVFLEKHEDFYSLSPHLPNDKNAYEEYYKRHASLGVPVYLRYLTDEIARIEKEWELV